MGRPSTGKGGRKGGAASSSPASGAGADAPPAAAAPASVRPLPAPIIRVLPAAAIPAHPLRHRCAPTGQVLPRASAARDCSARRYYRPQRQRPPSASTHATNPRARRASRAVPPIFAAPCWRLWRPTSFRTRPIPRSLRRPRLPAARKRRPRRRSASQVRRAAARASPPPSPPPRAPPRLLPSRRRRRLSRAVGWRCGRRARAGGTRRW